MISQQVQEFQQQGFESLERQKRGTKLINVAPKFRGLQQRKRSGQLRRNPNRLRKNNGKKNKKRGTRVISKGLVKLFISFSYHGFFRVIFLKVVKFDISKMPTCQYLFSGQKQTRLRKNNGKKNKKRGKVGTF